MAGLSTLPQGWESAEVDSFTEILDSIRVPLNAEQRAKRKGDYPYYGANGQVDSIDDYLFDGEHVLLAEDGGFFDQRGRDVAYLVSGKFWVNNHAHILRMLGQGNNRLLCHWFNAFNWMPYVSGTTRLKLTQGKLKIAPMPLPPLNEQRRIADKIDVLQAKSRRAREALEAVGPLLEKFRQSVLAAAFRGDLTAEWRKQHPDVEPAEKLLERIRTERRTRWEEAELAKMRAKGIKPKDDKWKAKYTEPEPIDATGLPELPEGWCWCRLSECGEMARGKSKHRPRNDPRLYGDSYPFIQTGEVARAEKFIHEADRFYSEFGLRQSRLFPMGTLCITIAANIADTAILGIDACFPDSVVGVIVDEAMMSADYLDAYFRVIRDDISRAAPATAQKNINLAILNEVLIPLPPLEERAEIDNVVANVLATTAQQMQQMRELLAQLDQLDQSVLAKAFRGELVPQDSNDEPASVLLERIKTEREAATDKKRTRKKTE